MFKTFVVLLISTALLWKNAEAIYARGTSLRMRYKLIKMGLELYKDAKAKVMAIWHMKKQYSHKSSYHIARLVYFVRRKYARMIFVYFKSVKRLEKLTQYTHLDHLREIQHLAFDIDNVIQSMGEYEDRRTRQKRISRMGGPPPEIEDGDSKAKRLKEERLKQRAYVERKKMLWSLKSGNSRDNLQRSQFKRKDPTEEGFDSDSFNL